MNYSKIAIFCLLLLSGFVSAQIPKPSDVYGFEVGADYKLADYDQMLEYYDKLDASTDRVQMIEIGKSVMGRPIKLMFISSEENMKELEKWRTISEKLSRARISNDEAIAMAKEGKAIVWFDGGMHATEKAHAQMTSDLVYRIASEESDEMKKIRNEVITLVVPVINPDGLDIVVDWYKKNLGTPYETTGPPILYQKYVGHDNNRDWFMNNMPETRAVTSVLYSQWYPQIVHNHHQTSPSWARIFLPPFRSPVNPRIHPGVTTGVNLVGTAMANRFAMKKMPGVISGTNFSMWWNGGMRTTPYYHNQIGILTETAHATPTPRFYPPDSIPKNVAGTSSNGTEIFYPYPWKGGESHFRDAVDYMLTASLAILNLATDKRQEFLYNIYSMGADAINDSEGATAYIIPKSQWDKGEARNLTNVLMQGGVEAHRVTKKFNVGDTEYESGSVIFYGSQAFRPFLADLMEKQEYPNQYRYPGGPPVAPYDLAGWTLPMQMGVQVDRITENFTASTVLITEKLSIESGEVIGKGSYGFIISNKENLSSNAVNNLLAQGQKISISTSIIENGKNSFAAGAFIIENGNGTQDLVSDLSTKLGLNFFKLAEAPKSEIKSLSKIKIGIYKSWRANMDEGWSRWVFEQHDFDLDTLHNIDIQTADLSQYSAIIIPSQRPSTILHGYREGTYPSKYTGGIGLSGTMKIQQYVSNGGTLIAFDQASDYAIEQLGLPVQNVTSGISPNQFFIPGSLVRINIDTEHQLGYGMQSEVAASFSRSRAFKVITKSRKGEGGNEDTKLAPKPDVDVIARYADKDILMSGWATGQDKYLKGKAAMLNVKHGEGNVVLFGFRPQFRGQPRGTYKLIFNAIYSGALN